MAPHIGGGADFSNLAVLVTRPHQGGDSRALSSHRELADAVVIDEAHHFRNPGRRGDASMAVIHRATTGSTIYSTA